MELGAVGNELLVNSSHSLEHDTNQKLCKMFIVQSAGLQDAFVEVHPMGILFNPQEQLHMLSLMNFSRMDMNIPLEWPASSR